MNADELAASAIRAVDEIKFILSNFDANSPDAVSDLDQVCSLCGYLAELEPEIRGGCLGHSGVANMINVLRLACEMMANDAFALG